MTGLALGLMYQIQVNHRMGFVYFFIDISIPVFFLFLLFLMRALGAGDIKLLSMTGSFFEITDEIPLLVSVFLVAAVMSFLKLYHNGNLGTGVLRFFEYLKKCVQSRTLKPYEKQGSWEYQIHFSIAVLIGSMCYLGVKRCTGF